MERAVKRRLLMVLIGAVPLLALGSCDSGGEDEDEDEGDGDEGGGDDDDD